MSPVTSCPHPGCSGTVTPTGYCLASGERVDPESGRHSAVVPAPGPGDAPAPDPAEPPPSHSSDDQEGSSQHWIVGPGPAAAPPPRPAAVTLPPEHPDPTVLPEITLLDRADSGSGDAAHPVPAGALPLPSGTLLAGQYRLVRPLGYGGMGEVCLAHDTKVDGRAVAIKMLHADLAADSYSLLKGERKELVELNHDGFIRVFNYGHHDGVGDFLVLQYVDGLNLEEVRARARERPEEFGHERFLEFALAYGVRILAGLAYLHAPERGKVYGDLKPPNVMHDGSTTKLVDVGSVRRAGAPGLTTSAYRAPSVGTHGESLPQDDLFSLGETLRTLCGLGATRHDLAELAALGPLDDPAAGHRGLGLVSLARALRRATRTRRADRFATAKEMEEQLRGVFRELRSLRTGVETFEPSPLFLQSAYALDGGLGAAPEVSRWAAPDAPDAAPRYPAPGPPEVARRLPVPRPDPDDDHHGELSRLSDDDPEALLQHTGDWRDSPEVHLLRCRLRLRVEPHDGPGALSAAETALALAEDAIGPARAPHDWRLDWHRGLLALARSRVAEARGHFDRVYAAIPGEYAPKLALGHCAEHLHRPHEALTFYEAVRLRNPSLGSAAFGAARARLALGGPDALGHAIAALDAVPQHSRHRTAARTAAVRILAGHARDAAGLGTAVRALAGLFSAHGLTDEQARVRMKAEVWGVAQRLLAPAEGAPRMTGAELRAVAERADPLLEFPADERALRKDLSRFYRGLALQAARDAPPRDTETPLAELLLDRAYAVRPFALRHHRDTPWPGKKIRNWIRNNTPTQPGG
ncbi:MULTISPECIES: tetratricopeptide repeat protein [Streptomyces]|uniref:tetratricopeptide repeat protein n=1 Tax=Streptomyces TaxID=1883 RepID=UPI001E46181A|nr:MULTISPECIES: tetratricopeptide repeat protein [Streptomyces]UFQ16256.1 protein kinase [Streptomyces huasconensis]WCL85860.1 tetratricopeptide repeat protein [Streptomyces sp. JCM 35825]